MKKYLLGLTVSLAMATNAAVPYYQWSSLISTTAGSDMATDAKVLSDGNFAVLGGYGVGADGNVVFSYRGEEIVTGASHTTTSAEQYPYIMKVNASTGEKIWAVAATQGNLSANSSYITSTVDGGVLAFLKLRSSSNYPTVSPVFVDNDGVQHEIALWPSADFRVYEGTLVKIGSTGSIEWIRTFFSDVRPVPMATGANAQRTAECFTLSSVATDPEGNFFIGGNLRAPIAMMNAGSNLTYIITPHNVARYNGDPQQTAGSSFIVKLDKDGNFVKSIATSGEIAADAVTALKFIDGKLYAAGYAMAASDEKPAIKLGDSAEVAVPGKYKNLYTAVMSKDLSVEMFGMQRFFPNGSNYNNQINDLQVADGTIYVIGGVRGGFGSADSETATYTTNQILTGYVAAVDATSGNLKNAWITPNADKIYGSNTSAFIHGDKLCVLGYQMTTKPRVYLRTHDLASLEVEECVDLMTSAGMPTSYMAAYDDSSDAFVIEGRANKVMSFYDSDATLIPLANYGCCLAGFTFKKPSGTLPAETEADGMVLYGGKGEITVESRGGHMLTVYDIAGAIVYSDEVPDGVSVVALPAGVYLTSGGEKVTVR